MSKRNKFLLFGSSSLLFVTTIQALSASPVAAQDSQVSGRILDSRAMIQSATVVLKRVDTGVRRETTSSSEGFSVDRLRLKAFSIERFTAQVRAEILSLTNHANFANPDTRRGSGTFGQVTSLVPGNQARIIQLGLHLRF